MAANYNTGGYGGGRGGYQYSGGQPSGPSYPATDTSGIGGLQLSQADAQALADFLGIPSLADNPNLLSEIVGLGGYDSRIAHQSNQLAAQASYLSAQAQAAHYAAMDAVSRGQLQLAQQHEAFAQKLDLETQRLSQQKQIADAQMAYVSELGKLAIRPEDAYKYEFARYGMQTPQGNTAVPSLPIPDIVKSMLATVTPGTPEAAPSTINPALSGLIPGATPSAQNATPVGGQGMPANYSGQTMTLSPYLQNLFAQQGNPTAGIPVPTPGSPLPAGYQYPQVGTPSAQSLRYLSPDQKGNLAGYAQDINGTPAGSFQSNIDQLSPQGAGLELPKDYGSGGSSTSTADTGSTGFASGGLILHRSHPLLAERGVPEQVTPRPDLAALMGGANIHAPGPQAGIGPGLAAPGPTPGPSAAAGGPGPGLLAALAAMHGGLHAATPPSTTAGAPGGPPFPGLLGGAGGSAGLGAPPAAGPGLVTGGEPPPASGPLGAPGMGAPGGALPPPPGPQASLNFPPLPPMNPQVASMQMPTSREMGPNPTEPIMPKVPIPEGPLGPGSTGAPVTAVQRALERLGYFKLPFGANYGNYGQHTTAAVAAFQRDHGHNPTVLGHHDKQTAHLIRQRLSGYGKQPQGPNPAEMRSSDQHSTTAMTGTRSSGGY